MTDNRENDPAGTARLLDVLTGLASQAASAILAARSPDMAWKAKDDASPVSVADEAAQAVILDGLRRHLPDLPIVSEESDYHGMAPGPDFVLVDPLDGTKEFISGRDDFTVNIALIRNGMPHLGVVGAPAMGLIWRGMVGGEAERLRLRPGEPAETASERIPIQVRKAPAAGLTAAVSRSHLDPVTVEFLGRLKVKDQLGAGSAIKFCRIAEGSADVYPRFGTTCEWDIAAGHAVLMAAGGLVTATDGAPLSYGHGERDFRVPGFIAWGDPTAARQ